MNNKRFTTDTGGSCCVACFSNSHDDWAGNARPDECGDTDCPCHDIPFTPVERYNILADIAIINNEFADSRYVSEFDRSTSQAGIFVAAIIFGFLFFQIVKGLI